MRAVGLKSLDGRDNLRALTRQVERIEGLAGLELVRVGQLVGGQTRTPCHHESLGVEQPDLLPGHVSRDALLA